MARLIAAGRPAAQRQRSSTISTRAIWRRWTQQGGRRIRQAAYAGFPAWFTWVFVHLMYLVEFDNRLLVFVEWVYNYFTRNRGPG